jgi:hypothetical protein
MTHIGRAIFLVALAGAAQDCLAQEGVSTASIDCGSWALGRKQNRSAYLERYVVGYLDGLAVASRTEFWKAGGKPSISIESAYLWVDKFCAEKPLAEVRDGLHRLFTERTGRRFR